MYQLIKNTYPYYSFQKSIKPSKGIIFFIHGFAVNSNYHERFYKMIDDYDYYAIEHAGHGITPLKSKKQLSPYSYACEVAQLIIDLNLNNIILMGHSMGGGIAMMVYHMIPDRIKKLILITPMNLFGTVNLFSFLFKFNPKSYKQIPNFYKNIMFDYEKNKDKISPQEIDNLIDMQIKYKKNFNILKRKMISLSNANNMRKNEKNIKVDTLLLVGKGDGCINYKNTLKNLTSKNPNFKFHCFQQSGHIPFVEQTKEYFDIIKKFIESN